MITKEGGDPTKPLDKPPATPVSDPQFSVRWYDSGREARCPPDPAYPNGIDVDVVPPGVDFCRADLPYPAKRCGTYVVRCNVCGYAAGITTAGRPDDPRSVTLECQRKKAEA